MALINPPTVILIEDGAPLVRLLAWLFEDAGFEVASVRTAAEAQARFSPNVPTVAVLNFSAPAALKDAIIAEWKAFAPATCLIDIGQRSFGGKPASERSQADIHFEMPFDADDLIEAARKMQL